MTSVTIYSDIYRPIRSKYSFLLFVFDVFMLLFSAGHWLIYMYCREMRRNTRRSYDPIKWIGDLIMTYVSLGLWLIWIIFREIARR